MSDGEAEVTHLLKTAEPETEVEGVLQACRDADPPLQPFQSTPAEQAVNIHGRLIRG